MNLRALKRNKAVYRILAAARWHGGRLVMRACHAMGGARPKRVFFSSFAGRSYTDSPARVSEALHALRPDLEIVWQLERPDQAPDCVRVVRPHTLGALRAISTARCLVDNFNRPHYMLKFPDQLYVQTWHGDRPFKKILFDYDAAQPFPDGEQMDLAVSGSDFGMHVYRSAFRYAGEILQAGIPRNDALARPDPRDVEAIRERLGLSNGVRAMLYAPTFRDALVGGEHPASFDLGRALDALEASTGGQWLCLARAHSANSGVGGARDPRVRDVTSWPETADLLLCADLLITDYSSIAGDFILLDRPVILFQPDLDDYIGKDRQLYFDPRTSPYARAESEAQLIELLRDPDAVASRCKALREFYGITETGRSAEAVARWISDRIGQ